MIELKKISPEDSLEVGKLKDEFNRYAMNMKVQWSELSYQERKELYEKLRKVEDEIAKYE
jgi:membrane protein CcdC involved in cytochrome C biogenesis